MSHAHPDDTTSMLVPPPDRRASSLDATSVMDSPSHRIQRWIGQHFSYPSAMSPKPRDSMEARARRQHEHFAEVDWELEEFEREMALRFVMRDLQLGLEERRGRNSPSSRFRGDAPFDMNTISRAGPDQRAHSLTRPLRTQSSTATLQPLTLPRRAPSGSQPPSLSPVQSSFPPTPRTPPHSGAAPSTTPELSPHSPHPETLIRLFRPPAAHKHTPSVLSLSSHFSSCTSSASASADAEVEVDACPNASARSLVSQLGKKLKHGLRPFPASPPSPYRTKPAIPPAFVEVAPPGGVTKKRRVAVPDALAPKKRRLIVRGIHKADDDAVEGIRNWASGLGEVSRVCRTPDGTIWIEFRDKRVAENVCVLQAQVQIPRVGRVVLDWADGRHPG